MKAIHWLFNKNKFDAEFHVLKGLNFNVKKGEAVGILGKNGAGKSTLLKIISGIYHPSYGEVLTDGKISSLLELGAGFSNQLTGRENVYLKGTLLGYTTEEIDTMIDDIIDFADIGEYIDLPFDSYSSGMRARLGFALAVAVDPDILIIDEVFAVGDRNFQEKSRAKTMEFFEQNKTILFVSHSEGLIREFCNRVIYLKDGYVAFDGDVDEGLAIYQEDVKVNSYVPKYFVKEINETDSELNIKIKYGIGIGLTIEEKLNETKFLVEIEKFNDTQSQYFIRSKTSVSFTICDEEYMLIKLKKDTILDKINIRIKCLDFKNKSYGYVQVNTPEMSKSLATLSQTFSIDSNRHNVVTIEKKTQGV